VLLGEFERNALHKFYDDLAREFVVDRNDL